MCFRSCTVQAGKTPRSASRRASPTGESSSRAAVRFAARKDVPDTARGRSARASGPVLLRYRRDFPIAVVEAKAVYRTPGDGLQQAKEYAQILGLKFAYATNGDSIIEHDFLTGLDTELQGFPKPSELWRRLRAAFDFVIMDEQNLIRAIGGIPICFPTHISREKRLPIQGT